MLLLLGGGAAWTWRAARRPPEWYAPPDARDPAVAALGERVEYAIVEEFHRIRESEAPWTLGVREDQLNAWLAARLPEWVADEPDLAWPAAIVAPQVHVTPEGIDLAFTYDDSAVVVTRFVPRVAAEGALVLDVGRVGVGRVGLPGAAAEAILAIVDRIAPGGAMRGDLSARLLNAMTDGGDAGGGAIRLSDGRVVELVRVEARVGAIELTGRTRAAGDR